MRLQGGPEVLVRSVRLRPAGGPELPAGDEPAEPEAAPPTGGQEAARSVMMRQRRVGATGRPQSTRSSRTPSQPPRAPGPGRRPVTAAGRQAQHSYAGLLSLLPAAASRAFASSILRP